jgi:hypothetical protein
LVVKGFDHLGRDMGFGDLACQNVRNGNARQNGRIDVVLARHVSAHYIEGRLQLAHALVDFLGPAPFKFGFHERPSSIRSMPSR